MKIARLIPLFLFTIFCCTSLFSSESIYLKNIYNHLLIEDIQSACQEAEMALNLHPDSKPLFEAYIKALGCKGDDKELFRAWQLYQKKYPGFENRELIEVLAWSILQKGSKSQSPLIRIMAVLGSFLSQDAKGIKIIAHSLEDPNSAVRAMCVELCSHLRDDIIKKKIVALLQRETNWKVKLELIKTIGQMKIVETKGFLFEIISNPKSDAEEKLVAIESLIHMYETVTPEELRFLVTSPRAGLRQLSCKAIAHCELKEQASALFHLLGDNRAEVRATALQAIGILRIPIAEQWSKIQNLLSDNDSTVSISAAWLLVLNRDQKAKNSFARHLSSPLQEIRILAASAIAATGHYGLELALEHFYTSNDPYVKMNLALGLIGQQYCVNQACDELFKGLQNENKLWVRNKVGIFQPLMPNKKNESEETPEETDQLTRLELLNILAMMKYPKAQVAIQSFLKNRTWGITGATAAVLLTECDEEAVKLVEGLLTHSDQKIRIQAALVLALWGRGEDAIAELQQSYDRSDWEMKERILESIGKIGAVSSIPFLVEKLNEPSQSLRIIAAFALLQSLYH